MSKTITSEILAAYTQCPHKAFQLLCTKTRGTPHDYTEILEQQRQNNQRKYLDILLKKHTDVQLYSRDTIKNSRNFLINATLESNGLAADCAILTKIKAHSSLGQYSYEPTIFVGTYSIKKEHKLELFFVSHVLEQIQNKSPTSGSIINLNQKSYAVKLGKSHKIFIPLLEQLQEWVVDSSPQPPPIILNKHCPTCQFQNLCRAKAEQEDNLSLLDGISRPKVINKYEKKGIFTVKQLSYTFKPRKRKRRAKNPRPVTHKLELQALAIREKKIYLQELPELTRQPVELFLDFEGIPDRQLYYLIGLLVCEDDTSTYYPFWADTSQKEVQIWQQFLEKANQYPNAPIYHYGSYESKAIAKLTKRYETDCDNVANRLVNINNYIYGKVYFPVYSNRLKEIGNFIGAKWTTPNASGLQTLVWRHCWDESRDDKYQDLLMTYNEEDCQALKLLTDELSKINQSADVLSGIDFANQPKEQATEVGKEIHYQFKTLLKFAYTDYDKKKISFRQNKKEENIGHLSKKKHGSTKGYQRHRKTRPKPLKIVQVPQRKTCPIHKDQLLRPTKQLSKRFIIDLLLTKVGIRKTIVEYVGVKGWCRKCRECYIPFDNSKYFGTQLYGHRFKAWITYQRIALRLPYESIAEVLEEQFHEKISERSIPNFISNFSRYYAKTEELIVRRLLESPFIHVDETSINIQGITQYVWVFTDGKYVVFRLRETREATIVHEFLVNYNGILISDFYPGYDSVQCQQQKCWVHLIRDLNNDLWETPFDAEFEAFVLEVRDLIIPIMETVQEYGLKKRNLNKFREQVDKFYKKMITDKRYKSDLALKYQKRFARYRESLFTFLEQDGIPWHNNTAENAIRHFAIQRDMSSPLSENSVRSYLVLLGIRQTCRFQGKSFFKFLFSEEIDLDKFETRKHK